MSEPKVGPLRRGVLCTWCVVTPPGELPLYRGEIRDVTWSPYWQRMADLGRVEVLAPDPSPDLKLLDVEATGSREGGRSAAVGPRGTGAHDTGGAPVAADRPPGTKRRR